jgi:hypothetical protein
MQLHETVTAQIGVHPSCCSVADIHKRNEARLFTTFKLFLENTDVP